MMNGGHRNHFRQKRLRLGTASSCKNINTTIPYLLASCKFLAGYSKNTFSRSPLLSYESSLTLQKLAKRPPRHPERITTHFLSGMKRKIGNFPLHPAQKMCERGFFLV